nr:hypothetical protein BaRGS_015987 [Batillaria attramentaria]
MFAKCAVKVLISTRVAFKVKLKRLRSYYVLSIITPVIFLSFTATLVFALPADSGEKMGTSITVLLAFAVLPHYRVRPDAQNVFAGKGSRGGRMVSYLAVYLTMLLGPDGAGSCTVCLDPQTFTSGMTTPTGGVIRKVVRILQVFMCWTVHKHSVSILAVYLTMLLGQTAMGVVLSVWILNLHFRDDEKPPGKRMRKFAILCQRLMFKTAMEHGLNYFSVKQRREMQVRLLTVQMEV